MKFHGDAVGQAAAMFELVDAFNTFQWPGTVAFSVFIISVAYMVVSIYRERHRK